MTTQGQLALPASCGQEWVFILPRSFPQKQPLVAAFDA